MKLLPKRFKGEWSHPRLNLNYLKRVHHSLPIINKINVLLKELYLAIQLPLHLWPSR